MTDLSTISQIERESEKRSSHLLVSAILAVRNEERRIQQSLKSLICQNTRDFDLEIIVVDGDSSDATQKIIEKIAVEDPRITLAINKQKKTPYAFNLGIQMARGEYICILGAHSIYAKDYIATCLEELKLHDAGGCSGRTIVRPGGSGLQARLIAWALAHPFGTSTGSMRTRKAGFADTVPYPIFLKRALLEVGCYDTQLDRNQDNDLSQRLRARGHKLYLTDKTFCEYFVSTSFVSLARYAYKTGFWNIISLKKNPRSMSLRHFVPSIFVTVLFPSFLLFLLSVFVPSSSQLWLQSPLLLLMMLYAAASLAAAFHALFREKSVETILLPIVFLLLHVSYGMGTISAVVSNARTTSSEPASEQDVALIS